MASRDSKSSSVSQYAVAAAAVALAAGAGSYFTNSSVQSPWYACVKPSITPPPIVFPIAWTTLYILLAISMARSMRQPNMMRLHLVNLALNAAWCYQYFATYRPSKSLITIIAMIVLTGYMIRSIRDPIARACLYPYIAWISFATLLNALSVPNEEPCFSLTPFATAQHHHK